MNVDFTAILAVLSLITGSIWAAYVIYNKVKGKKSGEQTVKASEEKVAGDKKERTEPVIVEFARFLFPVFFIVLIVRGFLVEPFQIPSGSMLSTLEPGDYILVNKFSYGLRSPIGYYKFLDFGSPERGDVIVFRYPENPEIDYIKRVIGLPGDKITYKNKILYINGKEVKTEKLGSYAKDPYYTEMQEQLGDVSHKILLLPRMNTDKVYEETVPPDHYFVMGDNRDNSRDSRYWGFVPDENLKGRAFMIWLHKKEGEWPSSWGRVGTLIE
ncbi:MAG: signal peptidase I [Thioalkalispiraceae bacterium]|jgi:signal peptidase I